MSEIRACLMQASLRKKSESECARAHGERQLHHTQTHAGSPSSGKPGRQRGSLARMTKERSRGERVPLESALRSLPSRAPQPMSVSLFPFSPSLTCTPEIARSVFRRQTQLALHTRNFRVNVCRIRALPIWFVNCLLDSVQWLPVRRVGT